MPRLVPVWRAWITGVVRRTLRFGPVRGVHAHVAHGQRL
jgi:hypothetical protein